MSATGLDPTAIEGMFVYRTPAEKLPERYAEFDRLMEQGGIEAVVEALKKEQAIAPESDPEARTHD